MKNSIFRIGFRLGLLALFFKSLTASGQMPDGGVSSAMIKLFGDNAFTAQADMQRHEFQSRGLAADAERVRFRRYQVARWMWM